MATTPLQAESARANPVPLSLHTAAQAFEDIADDLGQLSALVHLASCAADPLDEAERKALRAIMVQLDGFEARANLLAAGYFAAHGLRPDAGGAPAAPAN